MHITDKKIFLGLVFLIVLTIMLVVGISFIQQPQTTSSRADYESPLNGTTNPATNNGTTAEPNAGTATEPGSGSTQIDPGGVLVREDVPASPDTTTDTTTPGGEATPNNGTDTTTPDTTTPDTCLLYTSRCV